MYDGPELRSNSSFSQATHTQSEPKGAFLLDDCSLQRGLKLAPRDGMSSWLVNPQLSSPYSVVLRRPAGLAWEICLPSEGDLDAWVEAFMATGVVRRLPDVPLFPPPPVATQAAATQGGAIPGGAPGAASMAPPGTPGGHPGMDPMPGAGPLPGAGPDAGKGMVMSPGYTTGHPPPPAAGQAPAQGHAPTQGHPQGQWAPPPQHQPPTSGPYTGAHQQYAAHAQPHQQPQY